MTMRLLVAALPLADAATMTWTAGAVGYFDVANNWDGGEVPGSSDTMVLADGTVYLAGDATINNLKMSGGELVVGSSECPDGWSTTLTFDGCVRAYATPKTWLEAEEVCHAAGGTSNGGYRGHLALIGDDETNQLASLLCAAATNATSLRLENSDAESRGEEFAPGAEPCWIGITDSYANASGAAPPREQVSRPDAGGAAADDGAWAWADEAAVLYDPLYRSWARREPLFRGGANCGALLHRGYDPYSPPRPRWRTHLCSERLPFVCTRRGATTSYDLTVANTFTFTGGAVSGGGVVTPKKMSFTAGMTPELVNAGLVVAQSISMGSDARLYGSLGAWIEVTSAGSWGVSGDALLGGYGARVLSEGAMRITSNGVSEWAIHASGTLRCNGYGNANGGGDLSRATIVLASSSSRFVANGRSLAFRTPPVDLVDVSADAPVAREDVLYAKELTDEPGEAVFGTYAFGQGALESAFGALDDAMPLTVSAYKIDGFSDHKNGDGELLAPARGSYRLAAGADESVCIPWHASAREFQDAVNGLPDVAAVGGATVTRHGDGGRRWNFGFRYEVAYDRAGTATVGTLSLSCAGSANGCGCFDAVSRQYAKPTGWCKHGIAEYAKAETGRLCLTDVAVTVDRVVVGGETTFSDFGTASVELAEGFHALPATLVPPLRVTGARARGVTASAATAYQKLYMEAGSLTFAGPGYAGDDAAALLFGAPDKFFRGALGLARWSENRDCDFAATVALKSEINGGDVRIANPRLADQAAAGGGSSASLSFQGVVTWTGNGGFRGNGKVALQSTTTITTCVSRSGDGDECPRGSRGDGAPDRFQPAHLRDAVVVEIDDGSWSQGDLLMGEGATLTVARDLAVDDDASDRSPRIFATARDATPGREDDARNGWYSNPTCGDLCQASPTLRVDAAGEVDVAASAAIFEATLFNRGEFKVASSGAATLGDGGGGDGDFVVAGTLTQRGGVLDLERGALSGSGSVGVSGGRVLLPGTVAPSVSVSGGEAAIRGRRADLSSVAISNGTFKVLADAANVTLSSDLIISGGALRFPERDSYAATHRNNLHSGTRNLDRGAMVVHGHLNWTDGAISGNGDVNLMASSSVRSGFIERFARVVNHAAMFLEDGAVVAETEGYMENRGTVEMREPRSTYAGMFGRRPNPREAQPVLQYDWEDNMYFYNGKRVMVVGDDSIRDASLGVSGNYDERG